MNLSNVCVKIINIINAARNSSAYSIVFTPLWIIFSSKPTIRSRISGRLISVSLRISVNLILKTILVIQHILRTDTCNLILKIVFKITNTQ